jgi:hypothetical protein
VRIAFLFISFVGVVGPGLAPEMVAKRAGTPPPVLIAVGIPLAFVWPTIALSIMVRRNTKRWAWSPPNWRKNPFRRNDPRQFLHLGGYWFVVIGLGILIAAAMSGQLLSSWLVVALVSGMSVAFGLGILAAIRIVKA